jgi:hypothetical protein
MPFHLCISTSRRYLGKYQENQDLITTIRETLSPLQQPNTEFSSNQARIKSFAVECPQTTTQQNNIFSPTEIVGRPQLMLCQRPQSGTPRPW